MTNNEKFALHLKQLYTGGNWTGVCLKDTLEGISLETAKAKIKDLNSILALVYHMNYYTKAILGVLNDGVLDAHDKYSFEHPQLETEQEWRSYVNEVLKNGTRLSEMIAGLPDEILDTFFTDVRYGTYHRNFTGLLEHTHYHLGQIVMLSKLQQ